MKLIGDPLAKALAQIFRQILFLLILWRVAGNFELIVIQKYSRPNDVVFSDD